MKPAPILVTIWDAACLLHVTKRTVDRWIASGDLVRHPGGMVDMRQAEVVKDMRRNREKTHRFGAGSGTPRKCA